MEGYTPKSDFLWMVVNDDVPLTGSNAADHNLQLLIAFTRDPDESNRDWATMLLAHQEIDTPEVRQALLDAADDSDAVVRGEALKGLAERDSELARPLVERELGKDECSIETFEAARRVAHPSLLENLRSWAGNSAESRCESAVQDAIAACERS